MLTSDSAVLALAQKAWHFYVAFLLTKQLTDNFKVSTNRPVTFYVSNLVQIEDFRRFPLALFSMLLERIHIHFHCEVKPLKIIEENGNNS